MENKKVLNQHNMENYKDFVEKGINELQEEFLFFPAQIMSEAFRQDYPTGRISVNVNNDIGGSSGRYIGYGEVFLSMEDEHPVIQMPVRRSHSGDDTFDTFDTAVSAVTSKMLRFIGYDVPLSMRLEMIEKIRLEEAEKDAILDGKIAEDNKKREEAKKQQETEEAVIEETTEEVVEETVEEVAEVVEEPVVEDVVEETVEEEVTAEEVVEETETEVQEQLDITEEPQVEEVVEVEETEEVQEVEEPVEEVEETEETVEEVEEVVEAEEQASLDLEEEVVEEDSNKPNLASLMSLEDALNLTPEYDLLSSRTMREWVQLIKDPASLNVSKVEATNTFGLINFLAEKFEHGDNPIARELPKESEAAYVIVANGLVERPN